MNLMHQKKSLIKMMIHQYKQILINQNGHPFDLNNLPLMMKVTTETTGTEKGSSISTLNMILKILLMFMITFLLFQKL